MPADAPASSARHAGYGAEVVAYDRYAEPRGACAELAAERGLTLVPPFDDPRVIAGQGTAGARAARGRRRPGRACVVPVGGGGLISGCATALKALRPGVASSASSPRPATTPAVAARRGSGSGIAVPRTIADGLQATRRAS